MKITVIDSRTDEYVIVDSLKTALSLSTNFITTIIENYKESYKFNLMSGWNKLGEVRVNKIPKDKHTANIILYDEGILLNIENLLKNVDIDGLVEVCITIKPDEVIHDERNYIQNDYIE
jgi:hypothetical protein